MIGPGPGPTDPYSGPGAICEQPRAAAAVATCPGAALSIVTTSLRLARGVTVEWLAAPATVFSDLWLLRVRVIPQAPPGRVRATLWTDCLIRIAGRLRKVWVAIRWFKPRIMLYGFMSLRAYAGRPAPRLSAAPGTLWASGGQCRSDIGPVSSGRFSFGSCQLSNLSWPAVRGQKVPSSLG